MLALNVTARRTEGRKCFLLTRHAWRRTSARRVAAAAIEAALAYGRVLHVRGAEIHVIGRKEVFRYRCHGIDLRRYEGIHVVCRPGSDFVLTAYRNRDFRGLRPHRRNRSRGKLSISSIGGETSATTI
jgi:hypothetical protein